MTTRRSRRSFGFFAATALSLSILPAQNVVEHDVIGGAFFESTGDGPIYPGGGVPLNVYPHAAGAILPPVAPGLGAVTLDGTNGLTWYSNGPAIAATPHNAYPGPPAIAAFPPPPALPGMVTGMAIDPVAGLLWLTDGAVVLAMAPFPGGPVLVAPFVPFPGFPLPPLTGLDWDPITGTLWASDVAGFTYNFLPGGAPVGGPFPPAFPLPGLCTGVAIDKTGLLIAGARPLYLTGGGMILNNANGAAFPAAGAPPEGLTIHPAPQPNPVLPCACPTFAPGQALRGPATAGNPNFGIDWVGLPANNPCLVLADLGFNPGFPLINASGCGLGLFLGSPTLVAIPAIANAAGTLAVPLNLAAIPPGVLFYMQYVTLCPADPVGLLLSPTYQIAISAP